MRRSKLLLPHGLTPVAATRRCRRRVSIFHRLRRVWRVALVIGPVVVAVLRAARLCRYGLPLLPRPCPAARHLAHHCRIQVRVLLERMSAQEVRSRIARSKLINWILMSRGMRCMGETVMRQGQEQKGISNNAQRQGFCLFCRVPFLWSMGNRAISFIPKC